MHGGELRQQLFSNEEQLSQLARPSAASAAHEKTADS